MQEIVQEIGAYAGLAAVLGLAVLSALYFSQARDVKRLREWAGRAPERSDSGFSAPAVPGRVVAQPQVKGQAKPAPAQAAATGARPAASTPAAQQAAAASGGPGVAPRVGPAVPVAAAGAAAGAAVGAAAPGVGPGAAAGAAASEAGGEARSGAAVSGVGDEAADATAISEAGNEAADATGNSLSSGEAADATAISEAGNEAADVTADSLSTDEGKDSLPSDKAAEPASTPGEQVAAGAPAAQDARDAVPAANAAPSIAPSSADGARAGAERQAGERPAAVRAGEAPRERVEAVSAGAPLQAAAAAPPTARQAAPPAGAAKTPATSAGARAASGSPLRRAGQAGSAGPGMPPRLPSRPMPRPGASPGGALQQTQIIAPPAAREPWHRRLLANPLRLALSIAGLLIVLAAAAFGASQILDDDSGTPAADRPGANGDAGAGDGGDDRKPAKGKIVPSKVTVAVLNGTTIPGLAAQVGDKVGASGFDVGTVANASTQQRAESVVLFSPGHEREAAAVGRKLRINQREAIDPDSQSVAGDATVVVIAGQDQTP